MTYEKRVVAVVVNQTGEALFNEMATKIEIDDDASGEFLKISQEGGHTGYSKFLLVTPEEWPVLREAIDEMIQQCRREE